MSVSHRQQVFAASQAVVVKIGTNALSRPDDTLDVDRIHRLAEQLWAIRATGRRVVVVSSGAVGAGIGLLKLKGRPRDLPHVQAAAAAGQARLIRAYDEALQVHGVHAAQILLTANDFKHRTRYLNVRNTLHTLFEYPVIPIVNENDTVSISEIKFGDNDRLAAMVASLIEKPLLIILSVVDGLLDGDPSDPAARPLRLVENLKAVESLAGSSKSSRGTGGMKSKLESVRMATHTGTNVIIADGRMDGVLDRVTAGEELGTLFLSRKESVPAWKRWIGYTVTPRGALRLDEGAVRAVVEKGRSLLAIGVTGVDGDFSKGELVSLFDPSGHEFARGLSNFDARTAASIAGKRTEQVIEALGAGAYQEVIHRDNLTVMG
ncbi:Glutamate 5-kinase [Caulifigura coniformis]|uniref:Glutamate 5-kinase n=1 Tax=Caulifigura coniformis TaxID=2527983 RepID=A0A517SB63_9PLAN|nr:glutamate 5-kinase [Caulifigura coniformis]QDT53381.1 Glutamate 5-kinase [Caulifigura coniformis]